MRKAVSKILPSSNPSSNLLLNFKLDHNSIDEFYINLDSPHKTWLPGDEISGQIILITKKNLVNVVVTLTLIGTIKINPSSHSKLRSLKHSLFKHTIMIYGSDVTNSPTGDFSNGLHKGEHRFPFIVKLPLKRIFTSIDFGRGSIAYTLSSAIGNTPPKTAFNSSTNNSTSNPRTNSPNSPQLVSSNENTSSKFFKSRNITLSTNPNHVSEKTINIISPIDVSILPPPKPKRLIIRDPQKANKNLAKTQSSTSTIQTQSTTSSGDSASVHSTNENNTTSNTVGTPLTTINSDSNNTIQPTESPHTLNKNNSSSSIAPSGARTGSIKVALDIPQRGYIRGESIPIKISLNHTRPLQDLNGIILTFVRVCRLDNGPDGYLESFRKDLQQSILPLYVDPTTLLAEVNTSVRIPPDAFPTIVGCPLVSFQYFVEVLVNLSGKTVDIQGSNNHTNAPKLLENTGESMGTPTSEIDKFNFTNTPERSTFINTDKFKRSKRFLQLNTEIIVGTHRLEKADNISVKSRRSSTTNLGTPSPQNLTGFNTGNSPIEYSTTPLQGPNPSPQFISAIPESTEATFESPPYVVPNYSDINMTVPLPAQPDMTEKERVRAHEQALMPSAPDMEEDDEDHAISPIQDDILRPVVGASGQSDSNNINNNNANIHQDPYQFFVDQNNVIGDDDDLYNTPWPNINSATEHVPKYESSNDDRLVSPATGTNNNDGERADQ